MRDVPFEVPVIHVPVAAPVTPGKLDKANAPHVLALLDRALQGCLAGEFHAMVTAPVQKSVLNDAGIPFTGHTEYLAERTATAHVVMMLVGGGMRVALATTHLPLARVPAAITAEPKAACLSTGSPWSWNIASAASPVASTCGVKSVSAGYGPLTSCPSRFSFSMTGAMTSISSRPR